MNQLPIITPIKWPESNNDIFLMREDLIPFSFVCTPEGDLVLSAAFQMGRKFTDKAKEDAELDLPVDLIAISLMSAYKDILEILGEENQSDFAKEIFSRFCVGK